MRDRKKKGEGSIEIRIHLDNNLQVNECMLGGKDKLVKCMNE